MSLFSKKTVVSKNPPNRKAMMRKLMSTWRFNAMPRTSPNDTLYNIRQTVKKKGNFMKKSVRVQRSKVKNPPVIMHTTMRAL